MDRGAWGATKSSPHVTPMESQKVGHDFTSLTAVDQMCMCPKLFQFWLSLCNPPGFSVHGIL